MIIWLVYKMIYEGFIAPDTDKVTAREDKLKWNCSDQFLCSLEPMFHFYCSSVGGEADSLTHQRQDTNHPSPNPHPHTSSPPPSCIHHDQHTGLCALWFEVEKMALNQRTTNHRQAKVRFQQSLVSTCRHTYAYTPLSLSSLVYVPINACS